MMRARPLRLFAGAVVSMAAVENDQTTAATLTGVRFVPQCGGASIPMTVPPKQGGPAVRQVISAAAIILTPRRRLGLSRK